MTRITLWALSTLSAVVLLFGYSTSTSGAHGPGAPSSIYSTGTTGTSSGSSGSTASAGSGTSGSTGSGASGSGSGSSAAKTVTGSVAQTQWGPVQVRLRLAGGKIAGVDVLQYPQGTSLDDQINSYALPILTQETVSAQSAQIDMVSGATVTSDGYLQSLQSALDRAGL